jgi:hypothetical protein
MGQALTGLNGQVRPSTDEEASGLRHALPQVMTRHPSLHAHTYLPFEILEG